MTTQKTRLHIHLTPQDLEPLRAQAKMTQLVFHKKVLCSAVDPSPSFSTYKSWINRTSSPMLKTWRPIERYVEAKFPKYRPLES